MIRTAALVLLLVAPVAAQDVPKRPPPKFARAEHQVPMRDGVTLNTVVFTPEGDGGAWPVIFVRTPYSAGGGTPLSPAYRDLAADGYIFVFQDIRGRYKSGGTFVMCRPPRDKADPKAVDEASDTSDTIDWLLKNAKTNGRVGMLGISYPGWLTAVAMLDPHPALKAVSPQASPADMFLGDDFHHNGVFRLSYGFEYTAMMETGKTSSLFKFDKWDTFEWYLKLGALSNVTARRVFGEGKPTWTDFTTHPDYDAFWKTQSLQPRLTRVTVPTLNVGGWYDQEDFRGPLAIYAGLEKHDVKNQNFLVVGPWNHGGWGGGPGNRLGQIAFDSDTGVHYRQKVQAPFFAHYLHDKGKLAQPEALVFQTGANKWANYDRWPPKAAVKRSLYFHPGGKLSFDPPAEGESAFDEYVSDPANPVPYRPRPILPTYQGAGWESWMTVDQRFTHRRPDVLSYETEPLEEDVVVAGAMVGRLFAATSGTDADWVVRLIDVYPEDYKDRSLAGYQLMIAGEPARARFRNGYEKAEAVTPDKPEAYTVDLIQGHHRFRKGHRIMVQVSSSWFPLYDRNLQTFVPNIYAAKDTDFKPRPGSGCTARRTGLRGWSWTCCRPAGRRSPGSTHRLPGEPRGPAADPGDGGQGLVGVRG
ncbi:MAG: CocE/NonD family hydrolase [Gemmataceae bacterium]